MDILLFVLSYYIQLAASALLLYRITAIRSIYGLSIDTQICFLVSTLCRLVWSSNTRIIEQSRFLAFLAIVELFLSLSVTFVFVYRFLKLQHTTTQTAPWFFNYKLLLAVAIGTAVFVNPGDWFTLTSQVLVSCTMYIEAIALLPQLWLIRKMDDVEALTSHYVGLLSVSRIVRMIFWVVMYRSGQKFLCLLLADVLHTILSADYLYLWLHKLRYGGRLVYTL